MNLADSTRWRRLWDSARLKGEPDDTHQQLVALYAEPHRHYHNLTHLSECLREFDSSRDLARDPVAVELAIWFHDSIYNPRTNNNEEMSADLSRACLSTSYASQSLQSTVRQLILVTKHISPPTQPDEQLVVDIDLAILGQPDPRFREYEAQVRQEYSWVPLDNFKTKRAEILQRFLGRPKIYHLKSFQQRYEEQARKNLQESIRQLGA